MPDRDSRPGADTVDVRALLEAVAAGETTPASAEAALAGYATGAAGRFDAARERRTGVPEAVLAEGKTPAEVAAMADLAVETTGHVLITRTDADHRTAVRETLIGDAAPPDPERERPTDDRDDGWVTPDVAPDADHRTVASVAGLRLATDERAGTMVVHGPEYEPPSLAATVAVVTGGTADAGPAGEAAVTLREMGAQVARIQDVGVAGLARTIDALDRLREADVLVVAAGREGALPTVLAGLVPVPVIGLPVSTGYGHGGAGEAALAGMLQSCAPVLAVNIDAGFAAGVQAGLIARGLDAARS